jgi:hypothetical protein
MGQEYLRAQSLPGWGRCEALYEYATPFNDNESARSGNAGLLRLLPHSLDQEAKGLWIRAALENCGKAFLHSQTGLAIMVVGMRVKQKLKELGVGGIGCG